VAHLPLHAVLLLDGDSFRRELPAYFAAHPDFAARVTVLSGSVLDRAALVRAGAHTPEMQAVIVLQRRFARQDTHNLLRVLALRRALPLLPLFLMLGDHKNLPVALAAGVNEDAVLLSDMLRHGLLAANTITPGAAPLLINLFSSDPLEPPPCMQLPWEREYFCGLGQTMREVRVPAWLVGRTLIDATVLIFCARLIRELSREAAAASSGVPRTAAAAAADASRFDDVEELMRHLACRFVDEDDEGIVLVAVRHAHHAHRSHVHAHAAGGGGRGGAGPFASVHCNLLSGRRLQHDDTLFVVGRDLSALSHDVAESGHGLIGEAGGGAADNGAPGRSLWRRMASGLSIAPLGRGERAGEDRPLSPFYTELPAAIAAALPRVSAPPATPPPSPELLRRAGASPEAAPVAPVMRSISFFEPQQPHSLPLPVPHSLPPLPPARPLTELSVRPQPQPLPPSLALPQRPRARRQREEPGGGRRASTTVLASRPPPLELARHRRTCATML